MTTKNKFYITTAIDYVNAKPHVGHAFEKVLADAIARYQRLLGKDVFFLTGVDENAQKNVEAAQKVNISPKEFIDRNTLFFIELSEKLNISHDDFIRTTAKEHGTVVQKIVKEIQKNGDIYKETYKGLYCVGCEAYYTEKDLIDGKCPEHNRIPEQREEEAYFFKLSKYKTLLLKLIPTYIIPKSRANEILSRIKEDGLNDICISRKGAKWGIDFPNDKNYKIWVWFDALINYISGLKTEAKQKKYWPADLHIVGKGINWFHSVIWPALLSSAKYKLPEKLLVHGYLNLGGEKISKSLGNVIDPIELLNKYPSDVVRYSLLKCSVFDDSDYSEDLLIKRNNTELADKLGNLISRVSTLAEKYGIEKTKQAKELEPSNLAKSVKEHLDKYETDKALNEIFAFIDKCNEYTQKTKPWETKNKKVLYQLANAIKDAAIFLSPFLPETCEKIAEIFSFKIDIKEINKPLAIKKIKKAEVLFKKIEVPSSPSTSSKPSPPATQKRVDNNLNPKISKIEGIITMEQIKFSDFEKLDLRVATIKKVEDIEGADKLYKLEVEIGKEKRTILAGIKQHYTKDELKGKQIIVITNLEPRKMKGIESQGMLLATSNEDHSKVVLLGPEKKVDSGWKVS